MQIWFNKSLHAPVYGHGKKKLSPFEITLIFCLPREYNLKAFYFKTFSVYLIVGLLEVEKIPI